MSRRQRAKPERRRSAPAGGRSGARLAAAGGLAAGASLAFVPAAHAVDYTVDVPGDAGDNTCSPGSCTLRDALDDAAGPTPDRILFAASITGTITLGGVELPPIDGPLEMLGPGAGTLTISGGNLSRIVSVNGAGNSVLISGLRLTGGRTPFGGGAIINNNADLTIADSVLSGNATTGPGGGPGGAIYSYGGVSGGLTVLRSTIANNSTTADSAAGGGIFSYASKDLISNSTIVSNTTAGLSATGAGISSDGVGQGELTITNSTVFGNSSGGGSSHGGGVFSDGGALTVTSSTISGNAVSDPTADGGGVYTNNDLSHPAITNTIIADNSAGGSGPDAVSQFDVFQVGFSLIESASGGPFAATIPGSNIFGVDPALGALGANGGPTATQALPPTSPAVDKGSATGTDQRGLPRPIDLAAAANSGAAGGNAADIGAYEVQPAPVAPASTSALPAPVEGRTANLYPVSGRVFVKPPGAKKRRLEAGELVPIGSKVYARKGRVQVVTEYNGRLQSMEFYAGNFKLAQPRSRKPTVTVKLFGRKFGCGRRGKKSVAGAAGGAIAESAGRRGRRLWGKGRGRWRSKGQRGAGTVRGTKWLTEDLCNGKTRFTLRRGKLAINDFSKRGKVDKVLKRRGRYLAG